ncbi:hypothetical protein ACFL38_01505 [Candidatus Omnitrophota bacterium]
MEGKPLSENSNATNLLKFILAVMLLPVTIGISVSFYLQLEVAGAPVVHKVFAGILSFLFFYLFVGEPQALYQKGQAVVEGIFRVFAPLVKAASLCLPLYTLLFLATFVITSTGLQSSKYNSFLLFMIGFSFMFHCVFTAKALRSQQSDFLRAHYLFSIELVYIFNIIVISAAFNYLIKGFSFVDFLHRTWALAQYVYNGVFDQLFLFVRK